MAILINDGWDNTVVCFFYVLHKIINYYCDDFKGPIVYLIEGKSQSIHKSMQVLHLAGALMNEISLKEVLR